MPDLITADSLRARLGALPERRLVLRPGDLITPEALDVAASHGIWVEREGDRPRPNAQPAPALPPLKAVRRSQVQLAPFEQGQADPAMQVKLTDVIGAADGSPLGAGYMSIERGAFAWRLEYDEVDLVLEGELVIRRGAEVVSAGPGDSIFIPKGSEITFETPGFARFFYVTYPANWMKD